jgi:hypothetical protein
MSLNCCYLETVYSKLCIDLLVNSNRGFQSDSMFTDRGTFEVFRQWLHIWALAKYWNELNVHFIHSKTSAAKLPAKKEFITNKITVFKM